jgi:hypothetical protein
MHRRVLLCAFGFALAAAAPHAQSQAPTAPPREELNIPTGERWLGSVRIPVAVVADGKALPSGRYRVRLTGQAAEKDAVGQLEALERWVEFVQQNDVKGRAMASVVPARAVKDVSDSRPPAPGQFRVQRLKSDDYLRLWYNLKGDQILIHLPIDSRTVARSKRQR